MLQIWQMHMSKPLLVLHLGKLESTMLAQEKVVNSLLYYLLYIWSSKERWAFKKSSKFTVIWNSYIIILIGSSVKQFVEACKKATGVAINVEYLSRRPGDYAEVYSIPSKILRELNWAATYTNLEESLRTAWRWQKSHRDGFGSTWKVVVEMGH